MRKREGLVQAFCDPEIAEVSGLAQTQAQGLPAIAGRL